MVNGLSGVAYKVNVDTYNYVIEHGINKGIIIDPSDKDIDMFISNPSKVMSLRANRDIRSKVSKQLLQTNILNIADTFIDAANIYFPVRLDQRTRVYSTSHYFNYQSTDLSKALLLFSSGEVIHKKDKEAINYLKSYGAILYDGDFGKKSLDSRVKWVDNNSKYILDFLSNDIIDTADKDTRACFVSFCFQYKRFMIAIDDINTPSFTTYLPIQLDASCNGYQHISMLTRESKTFKHLNLIASTYNDNPGDFYSYVLKQVNNHIEGKLAMATYADLKEKLCIEKLMAINITSNMIKKFVMTYSYNVSNGQMIKYFKEKLIPVQADVVSEKDPDKA